MNEECEHKLCKVAHSNNKLTSDACLVMSFQLASKPGKFQFCDKISVEPIFPLESSTTTTSTTLLNEQTSSTPSQPPSPCSNRLNLSQNTPTAFSSLLLNALSNKNRVKEDSINNSIGSCQKGLNTKSITLGESFTNLMKSVSFSNLFASMSNLFSIHL